MEIYDENGQKVKKLYRSRNGKIAGICQGMANYFEIDVIFVRIFFLVLLFVFGGGLLAYLICLIAMPLEPQR
jgi:phage shock protein C